MGALTGWRFVKLVRDGISRYYVPPGEYVYAPMIDRKEYVVRLRAKLVEEAAEYAAQPSLGELADAYEVIRALARHDLGKSMADVIAAAEEKRLERGGFDDLFAMYVRTTGPDGTPVGGS